MRKSVLQTLVELAGKDDRILLLTADLGYTILEPFAAQFPSRFYNVGVAEQNMLGLAAGLAESGFIPFCYSMATFASMRPFEFTRNGALYHQYPVRILGVGGGFEYGSAGWTHYGLEDLGIMRTLPEMTVIAPADFQQARQAVLATWNLPGPVYYRLGKNDHRIVPNLAGRFRLTEIESVREGKAGLLLTTGSLAVEALEAADRLAAQGIEVSVGVVACLNPPPIQALIPWLAQFPLVFTVEAHFLNGGLGSLVAEIIAENRIPCRLKRLGVAFIPRGVTGSEAFMNAYCGLSGDKLASTLLSAWEHRESDHG